MNNWGFVDPTPSFQSEPELELALIKLKKEELLYRARRSMLPFIVVTKRDYEVSWHHRMLCDAVDRFARGEVKRLMVFMPPRHGKSEIASRRLPAFLFGNNPDENIIACSYSADLAGMMNRDVQRVIESPTYRTLFPDTKIAGLESISRKKTTWVRNNSMFEIVGKRGIYRCAGVGGGITGVGAHTLIIDDPVKQPDDVGTQARRDSLFEWYQAVASTRLEKDARIIIMMTRWHEDDLAGRLLKLARENKDADQWEVLSLPAINVEGKTDLDPRETGEALWPSKYSSERMNSIRINSGSKTWQALFQQNPTSQEGNIVKLSWFQYWTVLPDRFDYMMQSWDLTYKGTSTSDWTVGQIWGRVGARKYFIDQVRAKMGFNEQIEAIRTTSKRYPEASMKLVEEAANGSAVMQSLQREIPGLVPYRPDRSKAMRLEACSPELEAGNVFIPDPDLYPWVNEFKAEVQAFPTGSHDDQVDAMTAALNKMRDSYGAWEKLESDDVQNQLVHDDIADIVNQRW